MRYQMQICEHSMRTAQVKHRQKRKGAVAHNCPQLLRVEPGPFRGTDRAYRDVYGPFKGSGVALCGI